MGSAIAAKAPDAAIENMLRLVAAFSGHTGPLTIDVGNVATTECTDASGAELEGLATACSAIASASPMAAQLLGEEAAEKAKITEWLLFSVTELSPLLDDKLAKINDWLLTHTFLAGNRITLADLVVYATVSPAVCGFPVAQHGHFANLLRWYDHIHAVADSSTLFPAAKFVKPRFVAPVPPPPAAPKDKAVDKANGNVKGKGAAAAAAAPNGGKETAEPVAAAAAPEGGKKKKEKKEKGGAAPATPAQSAASGAAPAASSDASSAAAAPAGPTVDVLDIRVGLITKVGPHPNADSLYLEEIDLGEDQPRQVVSGLRKFVPEEAMQGRRVVVVCNLKPAKMRDVMSYGMVLCASNADHTQVDPIMPPEGAAIGERIRFEGYTGEPEAQLNPKKKIFEKIAPDLMTDAGGICTYKGVPFMTSAGAPCTASIPAAHIA